jgi:hypothetical protein
MITPLCRLVQKLVKDGICIITMKLKHGQAVVNCG